jgi:hypothetical protein
MFRLAKDLGLTIDSVLAMSSLEFQHWIIFYKLEAEETKKAMKK